MPALRRDPERRRSAPSATYSQVEGREEFKLIHHSPDTSANHPENECLFPLYDMVADPGKTIQLSLLAATGGGLAVIGAAALARTIALRRRRNTE